MFEVPYPTPFIAITEAVFTRLVAEQYDLLSRSLDAEHSSRGRSWTARVCRASVSARPARSEGGRFCWTCTGLPLAAVPQSAAAHAANVLDELAVPAGRGLRFSLSVVDGGRPHLAIQPVSPQGRVDAFLAVGKRDALTQFDRIVSSHASPCSRWSWPSREPCRTQSDG